MPTSPTDTTFRLKPKQRVFVESVSPFSFYVGGIGAGKPTPGACEVSSGRLRYPAR